MSRVCKFKSECVGLAISLEWINENFSIVMEKANVRQELLNEERALELS